ELLDLRLPLLLGCLVRRFQRRRHSVAEERDGRLHERHLFLHALEPVVLGLVPVETRARPAHRSVRSPAKVAIAHVAVGECCRESRLNVAVVHLALEECVADKKNAVAVLQFKRLLILGKTGLGEQQSDGESQREVTQGPGRLKFHRPLSAVKIVIAIMPAPAAFGGIWSGKYSGRPPKAW